MTQLIYGLHHLKGTHRGCVLAIGNFDGLHQGHQAILRTLQQQAHSLELACCVMLFEPHPQEFFLGVRAPARLMRLREKIKIFQDLGVARVCCLRFNKHLAAITAETFVREILVHRLGVRLVVCGDDFRFGQARQGDVNHLKVLGQQYQFDVYPRPTVLFSGGRVGSSTVREAIKQGDFCLASRLLMRPFTLSGRVTYGDQRGRLLGFPTANILLHRFVSPVTGVFLVRVHGLESKPLNAVANCGTRPTINGAKELLEVHLLDFCQDIYGRFLEIEFLKRIRKEKKFDSLEALKAQIAEDVSVAKGFFSVGL